MDVRTLGADNLRVCVQDSAKAGTLTRATGGRVVEDEFRTYWRTDVAAQIPVNLGLAGNSLVACAT